MADAMAIQNRLVPLHDAMFSADQPRTREICRQLLG